MTRSDATWIRAPSVDAVESSVSSLLLAIFLAIGIGSILAARAVRRSFVTSALSAPSIDEALARIRMGTIFACAFSEVPAVLGLAYLVLGGEMVWAPVFFGGALVSLAFAFPWPSQWEEWMSTVEQTSAGPPRGGGERRGTYEDG